MYNAFGRFEQQEAAQHACQQILDNVPGIIRIGTRMIVPSRLQDRDGTAVSEAISGTVPHSTATWDGQWTAAESTVREAADSEAEYGRRTGIRPPVDPYYILCAQGSKKAVNNAADLMRSLGACNVDVRNAKGDFLSGQPGIK